MDWGRDGSVAVKKRAEERAEGLALLINEIHLCRLLPVGMWVTALVA